MFLYIFELLNTEEKYKDTKEVMSAILREKKNKTGRAADKCGLFSEVVFGPTESYTCACRKYKGIMAQGIVCENCGVKVQSNEARRSTFGKIDLGDFFLVNPRAFKLLTENCMSDKSLRHFATSVLLGKDWVDTENGNPTDGYSKTCFTGPVAFKEKVYPKLLNHIRENNKSQYIVETILPKIDKCMFTHLIPVIPPDLRPIVNGAGSTYFIDKINKYYMRMRIYATLIKNSPIVPHDKLAILQYLYFQVSEFLLKKLSTKTGILRKYLLAKRVDYSARSVVVPDYTLKIDEIDESFYIMKEVFKPQLLPKLAARMHISELEALAKYDSMEYEDDLFDLCQELRGYPVIINRQPTLHRPSIGVSFIRNVNRGYVLSIPPIITEPFNADFDGDQFAHYFPIGGSAYNEALGMTPEHNLYLPSNGELAFEFKEDLVLGVYETSSSEEGREEIFSLIPEESQKYVESFRGSVITGKKLQEMFSILLDKMEPGVFCEMIDKIAHFVHPRAKFAISLSDYATAKPGDTKNPVSLMVEAGARGNWTQIKQINETRGFISDVEGHVIPSIINSSLLTGLTPNEFFTSCYGGLKGIIDSSRNTSISGYLTRRLIYIVSNIELSEDDWDCGSTNYLEITPDENHVKMLLYRVVKLSPDGEEHIITKDNLDFFVGKKLYLRSPATCKCQNGKICHKCYGYLFLKHKSRQIGYIAAQSIGERAAQLTLRTKHTSGATNIQLPPWVNIEDGFIKTKVPTIIYSSSTGNTITNQETGEEVDLPYSTIDVICENFKHEVIRENSEDDDPDISGDISYDDEDSDSMNFPVNDDVNRYTIKSTGKIARISLLAHDVIAAVGDFGKYLRKLPNYVTSDMTISDVLYQMIDRLGITKIHSVHFELLLSMFARDSKNPQKTYREVQENGVTWFKENDVLDNMILQSLIFERLAKKFPKLLLSDPNTLNWKSSIFMQLTSFEFGTKVINYDPSLKKVFGFLGE